MLSFLLFFFLVYLHKFLNIAFDFYNQFPKLLVKFDYGEKIDECIVKANKSLNEVSQGDLNITGRLENATVEEITINEKDITITTKLSGVLDASAGL